MSTSDQGSVPEDTLEFGRPRVTRTTVALIGTALALLAALVVFEHLNRAHRTPDADARSGAVLPARHQPLVLQAPDVALTGVRRFVVSGVSIGVRAQVLRVDYRPRPTIDYQGGTVTLYASHGFDVHSFLPGATRTSVHGHRAYFGTYRHQFAVAWPVPRGRWLCVSGFIGTGNGADPSVSRASELTVAAGVVVR